MSESIVSVKHLSKSFRLPHEQHSGLKQAIFSVLRGGKQKYEVQNVLQDVSFEINKGEFFGIVGRNGSGKSTLLKLLAGIYTPDKGSVELRGDLTPFIELGVGFNPELTGRENVYLNGALLGFSRDDMDKMYDGIVEFAELEKFMDQKLKNYSSGMQVRLAFSIAIQAETEILLLDEVLAVGDADFQKKCFAVFRDLKKQGRTIILVTHDMGNVEKFCDRVLIVDKGMASSVKTPSEAANIYAQLNINDKEVNESNANRWGSGGVLVSNLRIKSSDNKEVPVLKFGDEFELAIGLNRDEAYSSKSLTIGLAFINQDGITVAGPNTEDLPVSPNSQEVVYNVKNLPLQPGDYTITTAVIDKETDDILDFQDKAIAFHVISDKPAQGVVALEGLWREK